MSEERAVEERTASEAHRTLEGWYALHEVRSIDWDRWKAYSAEEQAAIVEEAEAFFARAAAVHDAQEGSSAVYTLLGHKGDLMVLHLRPNPQDLLQLELEFAQTRLAGVSKRSYSFVSVTELGQYTAGERTRTPEEEAFIQRRLKPQIPDHPYISFYPMSKKRDGSDNWYTLPLEKRRSLMYGHGLIGRAYRGEVQQMITGAMGFDDWEWGVTLFAVDALPIKKIVQEMRFDEASARYALFGPFYFGMRLEPGKLAAYMNGRMS